MIEAAATTARGARNLFIVGSMNCDTTILFDFLTGHSGISGGDTKEIRLFSLNYDKGTDWHWERLEHSDEGPYYLDASPTCFDMCLDVPAAERINEFCPNAKVIILIRNPIERAASHFNHLRTIKKLPFLQGVTFDDVIARQWPACDSKDLESVRSMLIGFSRYEKKIEKFVEIFGYDNVIVIHNDDLRASEESVVSQVFDFLEMDVPQGVDFSKPRYNHETEITLSRETFFSLLEELGDDYYRACKIVKVRRLIAYEMSREFNQPVGALVGEVGVGEGGWLFLAAGSNNVLEMYVEDEGAHQEVCTRWHGVVEERAKRLSAIGSRYFHVMLPEKITALGEKLHWPIDTSRSRGATFSMSAPTRVRGNIIDFIPYLLSLPNREKYFLKTDSHWNNHGAFLCYQLVCSSLGFKVRNDLLQRPKIEGSLVFDLGVKLPDRPQERAEFVQYRSDARLINDEGLVRYKKDNNLVNEGSLHVGSLVEFENTNAPNKHKIIIFGDSFCEYRDHLLTALMAETFEHTIFVWSTSIDYSICEQLQPDIVFCVMTERFMARVPDDTFDLRTYVETRLAGLQK